jgi:hypothetical protein
MAYKIKKPADGVGHEHREGISLRSKQTVLPQPQHLDGRRPGRRNRSGSRVSLLKIDVTYMEPALFMEAL